MGLVLLANQDGQRKLVKESVEKVCMVKDVVSYVPEIVKIMKPVIT